ncbi:MAG TPA: alpha/beta fold hydrolase [Methylobacter sp.]|jgi:pimeloyl-ACP methyl ester carboxylesterase
METMQLAFEEFGNPADRPLIILHGFFASSRNWRQVAQRLAARFHVYVPDIRNHGASPHHPLMDYPSMSADLLRFIEERNLEKANLLGHSMGGKIAMWLALTNPNRVDKLIVADIAPVSYKHSFDNTVSALKALPLAELSNRKQAETLLAPRIPELSYRQFLLQNLILKDGKYCWRIDLDIFQRMALNIAAFPNADHIAPFTGKALFIAGGDSDFVKQEDINSLFPDAALATIAGAGHWLHVQQPDVFTTLVENFLDSE